MGHHERMKDEGVVIDRPLPNDILFGRSSLALKHPGNVYFRNIISEKAHEYNSAVSRPQKSMIILEIIETVAARGGRFLKEDQGKKWRVVNRLTALNKTGHCMRDRVHKMHKFGGINGGGSATGNGTEERRSTAQADHPDRAAPSQPEDGDHHISSGAATTGADGQNPPGVLSGSLAGPTPAAAVAAASALFAMQPPLSIGTRQIENNSMGGLLQTGSLFPQHPSGLSPLESMGMGPYAPIITSATTTIKAIEESESTPPEVKEAALEKLNQSLQRLLEATAVVRVQQMNMLKNWGSR